MARKSSLGPFPKTHRWREIVERCGGHADPDAILADVRNRIARLIDDDPAISAAVFFAALPVATRFADPAQTLDRSFGIPFRGSLRQTLLAMTSANGTIQRAALGTFDRFVETPRFAQTHLETGNREDEWLPWRELDGSGFCEIGRLFFACLAEEYLFDALGGQRALIRQHAWELSKITQSFSARWFNKCAVGQIPDRGNVRWYLGHCLGKLDMELERELSNHVEPLPNPFRRKKVEPPSLGLGI